MITFVEGELVERMPTRAIVSCNGVGYELAIPLSTFDRLPAEGARTRVLTRLVVREDAHLLFGFASESERALFDLLLGVSRVGPKVALAVLSGLTVAEIRRAIAYEDVAMLARVSGVGKKTAERIVVELKDKIEKAGAGVGETVKLEAGIDGVAHEAMAALVVLGYSRQEAQDVVKKAAAAMEKTPVTTEELIRRALALSPA
ncbi:MAG TPA: Holliday junction branch migration protein RuvA [bacterium]|nr:Holliday junction branch migration protein RuvA [bacterium]